MWSSLGWTKVPSREVTREKSEDGAEECMKEPFLGLDSKFADEFDSRALYVSELRYARLLRIVQALVVINGFLLCAIAYLYLQYFSKARMGCSESDLARATSAYSPILNDLPVTYHDTRFNGTLWPPAEPDWSRLFPSDETEAIWEKFEPGYSFPLTRDDVIAMGKDPEITVKFPDEHFHLGDEAYIGTLDVLHKMHCLNTLRRHALSDYGGKEEETIVHGKLWYIHIQHCVDMLAQDLQCHASADVITYNWRDTQAWPFPDFSINRKCRDFDSVVDWRDSHAVDMDTWLHAMNKSNMAGPEGLYIDGIRQIPFEPAYYRTWGFAGSVLFPNGEGYEEPFPVDLDAWYGNYEEPKGGAHHH